MALRAIFARHRVRNIVIVSITVVIVLAVAVPYIYIHFIEGPPPPKLSLPATGSAQATSGSTAHLTNGTWNVGKGSVVGYRVDEILIGQHSTAVGRTSKVWGSLDVSGAAVTNADFTVNMASVESDQSERNAQFDGRIMDVAQYPTASFTSTSPIQLGALGEKGSVTTSITGDLTMHGVTKLITFKASLEMTTTGIAALADIPITFSKWGIANPSIGGFVTTDNYGTLEVLLETTTGQGNKASKGGAATPSFGGGTPVTVPSTTVPDLQLPSGGQS